MSNRIAIGIDIGGTNIKGVLLNDSGDIIHYVAERTKQYEGEPAKWQQDVRELVHQLKCKSTEAVSAIGLAAPGIPNETNSAIRIMPGRLNGLEGFQWADYLKEEKVWVVNDAHAALIAEAKFSAGQNQRNIIMITLGTGVGGGLLINGDLYQGNCHMAGHLGHVTLDVDKEDPGITGMPGTLESAIGDSTVSTRSFGRFSSTKALVEAYLKGDPFASYVWLNSIRKLALALCSFCNLLSPDLVILGGGITRAGDALYKPLADFIEVYEWKGTGRKTPVQQACYGDKAGAVGAAGFALAKMYPDG